MLRTARLQLLLLLAGGCVTPDVEPPEVPAPPADLPLATYTATRVTSACDDLSSAPVLDFGTFTHVTDYTELPFPFALFGEPATRFVATEQGQLFLGGASLFVSTVGEPQRPPDERIPNGWVAPFWDSRLTVSGSGDVRMRKMGTGADERLVIGFNHFTLRYPSDTQPNPNVRLSFQVALLRESQAIEFRYCQLDPGPAPSPALRARVFGSAAEIGLESSEGTQGLSYSFQTPLDSAESTIRFTPGP